MVSAEDHLVELTDIGHSALREPFFGQSAALSRRSGAQTSLVSFDQLAEILESEQVPPPRGLIFHTGRSGSTLLANLVGTGANVRVLKEPTVLSEYTMYCGRQGWREDDRRRLRTLIRATGRGLAAEHGPIIKFSSWTSVHLAWLAGLFPDVPVLFVWRSASAVISSLLAKIPPWAQGEHQLETAAALGLPLDDTVPLVDFYAHVWRACAESALTMASVYGDRLRFLAYSDMCRDPVRAVDGVSNHFRSPSIDWTDATVAAVLGRYSKDPTGRAVYQADAESDDDRLDETDRARVAAAVAQCERLLRLHRPNDTGGAPLGGSEH